MLLTEPGYEVVESTPCSRLPPQLDVEQTPYRNGRGYSENGEREPLYVLQEVVPGKWRTRLLVSQSPTDIIVRDVEVSGHLLRVVRLRVVLLHLRRWFDDGGSGRSCLYDRRHGGREKRGGRVA